MTKVADKNELEKLLDEARQEYAASAALGGAIGFGITCGLQSGHNLAGRVAAGTTAITATLGTKKMTDEEIFVVKASGVSPTALAIGTGITTLATGLIIDTIFN